MNYVPVRFPGAKRRQYCGFFASGPKSADSTVVIGPRVRTVPKSADSTMVLEPRAQKVPTVQLFGGPRAETRRQYYGFSASDPKSADLLAINHIPVRLPGPGPVPRSERRQT